MRFADQKFKKKYLLLFHAILQISLLGELSFVNAQNSNIVATIKPIHSLVSLVVGKASLESPTLLLKGTASPHTYGLKSSDIKILNSAKIIFRVSDNIEPFLRKVLNSLPPHIKIITLSETPGLTLLKYRQRENFEVKESRNIELYDPGHKKLNRGSSDLSTQFQIDGHIWLDPYNAIIMIKEINRALKEIAPESSSTFETNAAKAISDLQKISLHISEVLKPLHGKPYVVFHDAFFYFESRFNLPAIGAITLSPEKQTSAKQLVEIRNKIMKLNVICVCAEPKSNEKIIKNIIEGTNARVINLDPEGILINPGPSAYFEILNGITDGLQSCLM